MGRQYQSFRLQLLGDAPPFSTVGLNGLGDMGTPAYRDPSRGPAVLTKDAFKLTYGFAPSEEYLVSDPIYNTPIKPAEALIGAQSLPWVRPDIFKSVRWEKMAAAKGSSGGPSGGPGGSSGGGPGGGPGGPGGGPPGSPPVTEILLPPEPNRKSSCCTPSCGEKPACSCDDCGGGQAAMISNKAVATAYGGQSVVNIGSPGASTEIAQGDAFSAPLIDGYAAPGDLAQAPPQGFLSLITPHGSADWVKILAGIAIGVVIAKRMRKA